MEYIILTGSSKGLGKAIAEAVILENRKMILISRDIESLNNIKRKIESEFRENVCLLPFDLSNYSDADKLIDDIIGYFDNDKKSNIIFINNAGTISPIKFIDQIKMDDIKKNLSVNLLTPMLITSKLLNHVRTYKMQLKIINISSGAYNKPIENLALYSSAKASYKMYLDVLVKENQFDSSLNVVSVDPGAMNTGMQHTIRVKMSDKVSTKKYFNNLFTTNKLKEAEEVAELIIENLINNWFVNKSFIHIDDLKKEKVL